MTESDVAIVTGGAQGLGSSITNVLLERGYKVVVADIQDKKGKESVADKQKTYGSGRILFFKCDVTKMEDYKNLFDFTLKEFKRVDLLVNNAGVILENQPELLLSINVMGPVNGCKTALDYMGKSNGGVGGIVINTASLAGLLPHPAFPVYIASKHAVVGLTRSYGQAYHYNKDGVLFMALCPSFIDTPLIDVLNEQSLITYDFKDISKMLKPDYVAQGIDKLLDDKINGSTLVCTKSEGFLYVGLQDEIQKMYQKMMQQVDN